MKSNDRNLPELLSGHPGATKTGYILGPRLLDGAEAAIPFFSIRGRVDGPTIVVSAGSHGDELNAMRAAAALQSAVSGQELKGNLVVLPVLNPLALRNRTRFSAVSPTDLSNLHDSFPGSQTGDTVSRICHTIAQAVTNAVSCDLLIDLHTGALGNYCRPHCFYTAKGRDDVVARAVKGAVAFKSGAIICAGDNLRAYAAPSMIHSWAHDQGIAAIGVELGTAVPSETSQVAIGVRGIKNVLAAMGMSDEETAPAGPQVFIDEVVDLRASFGGLCEVRVLAGQNVLAGAILASITNLFGEVLQHAEAPSAGHLIGVTCLGALHEGERIARIGIPSNESSLS